MVVMLLIHIFKTLLLKRRFHLALLNIMCVGFWLLEDKKKKEKGINIVSLEPGAGDVSSFYVT